MNAARNISRSDQRRMLWRMGDLRFKLHSAQIKISDLFESTHDKKLAVWYMARRWGKSYLSAVKCLEKAIKQPSSRSVFQTAFQTDAVEIILPIFKTILEDCPEDIRPKWLESKKKWVFQNGSEIVVVGLDLHADKLRGRYADLVIIDEAGFVKVNLKSLYSSVLVPLTLKRKGARIVMLSTPPKNAGHSFMAFVTKAKAEGSFAKFTVYDNPLLTLEEIEEYRKEFLDEVDWQREQLCEDVRDVTTSVIPEWKSEFVQTTELPKHPVHWYAGLDIGTVDKTFYFTAFYDFQTSTLHVTNESSCSGKDMTTDTIKDMVQTTSGKTTFYRRIADNSHPLLLSDLAQKHQIYFQAVSKKSLSEMVNRLRVFVKQGRLKIDPACKELILNLETAQWNSKRDAFERTEQIGHADGLAALIYCVLMLDEHTNPIPSNFGYQTSSTFIPKKPDTAQAQTLKTLFNRR